MSENQIRPQNPEKRRESGKYGSLSRPPPSLLSLSLSLSQSFTHSLTPTELEGHFSTFTCRFSHPFSCSSSYFLFVRYTRVFAFFQCGLQMDYGFTETERQLRRLGFCGLPTNRKLYSPPAFRERDGCIGNPVSSVRCRTSSCPVCSHDKR